MPAYVGSIKVKNELINIMNVFAGFLNQSSPGNPGAHNAPFHYDYNAKLQVYNQSQPLWNGTGVDVITEFESLGETNHYAFIYLPNISSFISGDILYVRTHLFMGYDVSLMAQCDWIYHLKKLQAILPNNTLLYPGHGPTGLPTGTTTQQVLEENIMYIQFARQMYVNTCNVQLAVQAIKQKFSTWAEADYFLTKLSAPFRVPVDASLLGCKCPTTDVCRIKPPVCTYAPY